MVLVFEKRLTVCEIRDRRLSYPARHQDILPFKVRGRIAEFRVGYGATETPHYLFRCLKRGGEDEYDKPTISFGWSNVVRDKGLAVGDILKFYKEEDHPAAFYIEVYRYTNGVWSLIP